jgi:hypothetical protein
VTVRLSGWIAFVGFLAILAYVAYFSGEKPPKNVAYRWDSSILGLIEYAIVFGLVWLLTIGLDRRRCASRRSCSSPSSPSARPWRRSAIPRRSRA